MSTLTTKPKPNRQFDLHIKQAKAALREILETVEDLEDRILLAEAKARNAGKPGTPWEIVAKELGIKPPKKKRRRSPI